MKPAHAASIGRLRVWIVLPMIVCLGWCFAGVDQAHAQLKVAVVDVNKVFKGYYKFGDGVAQLTAGREMGKKEVQAKADSHHRMLEELATMDKEIERAAAGSDAQTKLRQQRVVKTQEALRLAGEINEQKANRQRAFEEQVGRVRTQIVEEIMVVVNAMVAREQYDLVLNKSEHPLMGGKSLVLYADSSLDITDSVLATLNKDHPASRPDLKAAPAEDANDPFLHD